jgi:hypothetical protein
MLDLVKKMLKTVSEYFTSQTGVQPDDQRFTYT